MNILDLASWAGDYTGLSSLFLHTLTLALENPLNGRHEDRRPRFVSVQITYSQAHMYPATRECQTTGPESVHWLAGPLWQAIGDPLCLSVR